MNKLSIYRDRRSKLAKHIQAKTGGGIAIITTAPETSRNRDSEFPYRHDSDFYYLTGFEEPGATLVIKVDRDSSESHLFMQSIAIDPEVLGCQGLILFSVLHDQL